ncbi:hypothetical protein L6R53_10505 [Myxococcota bacterium]|nr:hypothetical protein [Myxococcota bacterium]
MPGTPRTWAALLALAAVAGLVFTGTSTYDFAQYLDRQVHGLHCSFLPGLGSVDVTGASGCHVTLMSPYSSVLRQALWGGIPMSLLGMGTFALLLYRALLVLLHRGGAERPALQATFALSLVPVATSIVMGVIALQVLDAACKLCIGTYGASALAFVGALGAMLSAGRPQAALDDDDADPTPAPTGALAPRLGMATVQLGIFNLLPVAAWAAMSPAHERYIGTCGELTDPADKHGVLIDLGGQGTPAVEVLDPLCPSCKGFEQRLDASGQGALLDRQLLLFPLDATCNWMVSSSLHPGACTVSEAMLCAGGDARAVLDWAFERQEEIRTATAEDPEAAARMVLAAFPQVEGCLGKPAVRSKLNQSLRWAVKNQLPVLTPQLFVDGRRVCDADTDLGLDYTLARMLAPAATEGAP